MSFQFKSADQFEYAFRNNGVVVPETDSGNTKVERVAMTDALAWSEATPAFTQTVENLVREAIEPVAVGSKLLQRINYKTGSAITLPSIGAVTAADIPEGAEYPEKQVNIGPGAQITTIGKSGVAVKFTDEIKRYSQYDVVGINLKAAGRALNRHKEQKIWNMVSKTGVVTHNNLAPASSVYGTTSGMAYAGTSNGSVTMDNFYEAYGTVLMNGFNPNAIIVHPLTFTMFLTDPVMRTFAMCSGNMSQWFNGWNGSAQNIYPWGKGITGGMGPNHLALQSGVGATPDLQMLNIGATPKFPDYFGLNLSIIVSPYVPYNVDTKLTDIFVVDTNNMGVLIVDEEATVEEVPDRLRDMTKIKIRERYAIAPLNEGNAVAVLKNVKVTANEMILPFVGQNPTIAAAPDRTQAISFS